ncbi:related to tartrate transporter [Lecanosticta acicola]|uniref:Related to tartrate transporter n=1 Tax=Lecanosticta acicola TaxID=111012 RepID=A0AAI8Z710_9PEZI|nr:related to tartrate transporter [Lecanosticta acicola]
MPADKEYETTDFVADEPYSSSTSLEGEDPKTLERRILRKVDIRLLPTLAALYCIALVDRTNISVARISGLDEDLRLDVGDRASIVLLVFFVGYVIFEIPSNILIRKIGPAIWLGAIGVAWGAGYYPGCVYLIASWYKRYEVQKRFSFFFVLATAISGFANIFALGLIQISKVTSYKGWRWIYIIEGAMTILVAIAAYFIVVDFPQSHRNKFLTPKEKSYVVERLAHDRGRESDGDRVTWRAIWNTAKDWKVWTCSVMYFGGAVGSYAFTLFLPIILQDGLGFSRELSFLLSAFPPVFAALEVMALSWVSDKIHQRGIFVIGQSVLGIVGLVMVGFLRNQVARYVGAFLGYAGATGLVVSSMAWLTNNVRGDSKRSVATAIAIMLSGISGIYSSLVFRQQDAPGYVPGIYAVIAVDLLAIFLAVVTVLGLRRANKRAEQGRLVIEGLEGFRYTL